MLVNVSGRRANRQRIRLLQAEARHSLPNVKVSRQRVIDDVFFKWSASHIKLGVNNLSAMLDESVLAVQPESLALVSRSDPPSDPPERSTERLDVPMNLAVPSLPRRISMRPITVLMPRQSDLVVGGLFFILGSAICLLSSFIAAGALCSGIMAPFSVPFILLAVLSGFATVYGMARLASYNNQEVQAASMMFNPYLRPRLESPLPQPSNQL